MTHKKIGILGGTFDPVHYGHLALANAAYRQFAFDEVWMMPSKIPPHKAEKHITSEEDRIRMVLAAIQNEPHLTLSCFEMEREGSTYTFETLQRLHHEFPEVDFFFIMGGDSLRDFAKWREPAIIASLSTLVVASRDEMISEKLAGQIASIRAQFDARIEVLKVPCMEISSSGIRRMAAEGKSISEFVPPSVEDYILKHRLYQRKDLADS